MDEYDSLEGLELNAFQELLVEYRIRLTKRNPRSTIGLNKMALRLGVSPASLSTWMNGIRVPDLQNALILSAPDKLGPRVLEVLGYPPYMEIHDPNLRYIIDNWGILDENTREQIYRVVYGDRPPTPGGGPGLEKDPER